MCGSIYLVIIRGIQLQQNAKNSDAKKCEYSAAKFLNQTLLFCGFASWLCHVCRHYYKISEMQRKDNRFTFRFFQSYKFKTPMVYHWTCSATSLKFSSKSIHHRLGCIRIKTSMYCNFCSQGLSSE